MTTPGTEHILRSHLPEKTLEYCLDLWKKYPFRLIIKPSRVTKAGDYCAHRGNEPVITMNRDLSPYLFLVTYLHEFSHHAVWMVYGNKPLPHGKEWKLAFKTFMEPVMKMEIFPPDLQARLAHHLVNPKASSFSDQKLTAIFRKYDETRSAEPLVSGLPEGALFSVRGRAFRKGKIRRTRFECREVKTGRLYLVPADLIIDH
jgi:hypothetical protein